MQPDAVLAAARALRRDGTLNHLVVQPLGQLALGRDLRVDEVGDVEVALAAGMQHYIVGHVGDGNFHIAYLVDPTKPEERELAEQLNEKVVRRALALEGTCSGEHGVGLHKMGFLVEEAGADAIAMMQTIKRALDPKNILNPGKIFAL